MEYINKISTILREFFTLQRYAVGAYLLLILSEEGVQVRGN